MVYSPEYAQIMHSEKKGWFPTGCILAREGRMGMQQTAAESHLFAPRTGFAFHMWLFLGGGVEYVHWLSFPIERNIFEPHAASPGMIHGVIIKLLRMHDVTR